MSFDQRWLQAAITATAERAPTGMHGTASIVIGKKPVASVAVDDGRVTGPAPGTPQCELPFSTVQAEEYLAGEFGLSVAYMRGDFKPTGSTAAILAVVEVLDAVRTGDAARGE